MMKVTFELKSIMNIYKTSKYVLALALLLTGGIAKAQVTIHGNVYGGGNHGVVRDDAIVNMRGGTVESSLYGGGKGSLDNVEAGLVKGNTKVDVKGGIVEHSLYGGGELGSVGTFTEFYNVATGAHVAGEPKTCITGTGKAEVLISGGQVGKNEAVMPDPGATTYEDDLGYVFCGSRGEADTLTYPSANLFAVVKETHLKISGSALITASAYGGCENGLVMGDTHVEIAGGQIGTGYNEETGEHDGYYTEGQWNAVIGKIKNGTFTEADASAFHECDHWPYGDENGNYYTYDIYADKVGYDSQGGALYATDGHTFYGNVFGGGSGYYSFWDEVNTKAVWRRSAGRVWGNTVVDITGGHILTNVYGGNEQTDVMGNSTVNMTGGTLGVPRTHQDIQKHPVTCYLFGAGKGDQRIMFNTWTNVENAQVNISKDAFIFGSVFGGGEDGHVLRNTCVTVKDEDTSSPFIGNWGNTTVEGNVFGAGRGFSGEALTAGGVGGNTEVNIEGGTMLGSVYGGGRLASVGAYFVATNDLNYGDLVEGDTCGYTIVNITGGTIGNRIEVESDELGNYIGGNVFGGSKGRLTKLDGTTLIDEWEDLGKVKQTTVNISEADGKTIVIKGHVYGGGEIGCVEQNTLVNIDKGSIGYDYIDNGTHVRQGGNVYGGGKGTPEEEKAGLVKGNSYVDMSGGFVQRSIYGGGEFGSVGTFDYYTADSDDHFAGEPMTCQSGTGLASVIVSGGQVGLSEALMPTPGTDAVDDDFGYIFAGCRGTNDPVAYPKANILAVVDSTYLEISDSTYLASGLPADQTLINASVYGGCENGLVMRNTNVLIAGGQIGNGYNKTNNSWDGVYPKTQWTTVIDAIKSDDPDASTINSLVEGFNECDAWPFGNSSNQYLTYDVFADEPGYDSQGGSLEASDGNSFFGNVFGGGSGYYPYAAGLWRRTAGRVYGNTNVEIRGGHILTAVFGAGEIADVMGTSSVKMTGGTVGVPQTEAEISAHPLNSHVFGGGKGDPRLPFNEWTNADSTNVVIMGGVVFGSVFGGGEDGHILGNTAVIVKDSLDGTTIMSSPLVGTWGKTTFDGNVFGGGRGLSISSPTVGGVVGNTSLTMEGGHVLGSVYGGGRMAAVGVELSTGNLYNDDNHGQTTVTVSGGIVGNAYETDANTNGHMIGGNVYGASRGGVYLLDGVTQNPDWASMAKVRNTDVNISQGRDIIPTLVKGNVYGGGEIAQVTRNTDVDMTGGTVGTIAYDWKNGVAHTEPCDTILHITGGNVFGGGHGDKTKRDAAWVMNNSAVTIGGGQVWFNVYGGGEMASVGLRETIFDGDQVKDYAPVENTGYAKVTITGGQVGPAPKVEGEYNIPVGLNGVDGYVFGGGKGIGDDVTGVYKEFADVNYTVVTVDIPSEADQNNNRIWGSIFGGAEDGHVLGSDTVRFISGLLGTYGTTGYDGNIFGGGRNYSKKNYTAGRTRGNINVEMEGGQVLGSIFGGGRLALTGIGLEGVTHSGTSEESYKALLDGPEHGQVLVKVTGGTVGNLAHMRDRQIVIGDVYGGGKGHKVGIAGHPASSALLFSLVKDTEVEISGSARVYGSVYGGGEVANVGNYTWNQNGATVSNIAIAPETGHAKVTVSGGTIGLDDMQMNTASGYPDDFGHVFGGGAGWVESLTTSQVIDVEGNHLVELMATVGSTEVEITDDAFVLGSVYGGGDNGIVLDNTWVKIQGGQIGAGNGIVDGQGHNRPYSDDEWTNSTSLAPTAHWDYTVGGDPYDINVIEGDKPKPGLDGATFYGNVFGGGSGYYPYGTDENGNSQWLRSSGQVWGNTRVEVSGGHILSCLYGGCEITNVGRYSYNNTIHGEDHVSGGKATVVMTDGTIGVPRDSTAIENHPVPGYLYGSGKGDPRIYFNTWTNVWETDVTISGGHIYGGVFGGGEDGHVMGDVTLNVSQVSNDVPTLIGTQGLTSVDGIVFGGGRGTTTYALTAGTVSGNVTLTMTGGTVLNSVYGGGFRGSVGTYLVDKFIPDTETINPYYGQIREDEGENTYGYTYVTIGNDQQQSDIVIGHSAVSHHDLVGNVYGGGKGIAGSPESDFPKMAMVKETEVNIKERPDNQTWIVGSVFGSGEDGHVLQDTHVNVSGGQIGGQEYVTSGEPVLCADRYHGNVYGGGRGLNKWTDDLGEEHYSETAGGVFCNTNVTISGGRVCRNVYGGGNLSSVGQYETNQETGEQVVKPGTGLATVTISGGKIGVYGLNEGDNLNHGNVFGSSHGLAGEVYRDLAYVHNTDVRLEGDAVAYGAVFGGGEDGHVNQNAKVSINGEAQVGFEDNGSYNGNVYGGGRGINTDESGNFSPTAGLVKGHSRVYLNSGTVWGDVYGGGHTSVVQEERVVNINGGTVKRDVYGGGNTAPDATTYYSSLKTVNVRDGHIEGNVFGCSKSANEGDAETSTADAWTSFVNITGGTIDGSVYGAGYERRVNGSVCVNVGYYPIVNAPNHTNNLYAADSEDNTPVTPSAVNTKDLVIKGDVFGGSYQVNSGQTEDLWNTFDVTGYSYVYVDGTDYDTQNDEPTSGQPKFFNLEGGLYGCGTHCESGAKGRNIFLRNYGQRNATDGELTSVTRNIQTVQRCSNFLLDNANVNFTGYRDISGKSDSLYAVVKINENLYAANASSLVLGSLGTPAYMDSIVALHSTYLTSGEIYADDDVTSLPWGWIGLKEQGSGFADELLFMNGTTTGATLTRAQENVILFNGISRLWVRYHEGNTQKYGELEGFFRMRASYYQPYGNESFAYARPKLTVMNGGASSSSGEDNKGDGGFLSYMTYFNFHTSPADGYQAEGNDGGYAHTNTKQYPYSNVMEPSAKGDMEEYRLWAIPKITGRPWYVDGRPTGGIGVNDMAEGRGLYPDLPKMTVSSNASSKGIYAGAYDFDNPVLIPFNQENDVVYVVGAVNSTKEMDVNASGILNQDATKPLRLYRYPGGHIVSQTQGATDPGANYKALVEVESCEEDESLTLNNVVVDGLFGYDGFDAFNYAIPTSFNEKGADMPLVVTHPNAKLTMNSGTTLMKGYNNTDADLWYTNADYIPSAEVYHGGGLFVDASAYVNVADSVFVTGNKQYHLVNGQDHAVNCNVYLPTFKSHLYITDTLAGSTRVGVTSPNRNTAAWYYDNTFSPVAEATNSNWAASAWEHCDFIDDQGWFFVNGNKTSETPSPRTTYYNATGTKNRDNRTLYFGWTWANVVRKAPTGYNDDEIDSPEDLAWLITSVPTGSLKQTADIDMKQYVWVPIGDEITAFAGSFDGQGHLIKNLYIDYIGTGDLRYELTNYGLFGSVDGGTVDRTFLVSSRYQPYVSDLNGTAGKNIGGLVGYMEGTSMVSNSEAAVLILGPNLNDGVTGNAIGGLVAKMSAGEIHSSMAMPNLYLGEFYKGTLGGLVGNATGGNIYNSFVNGNFDISSNNTDVVAGGLLGINTGAKAMNCYVTWHDGSTSLSATNFGSLAASNTTDSNMKQCYVKDNTTTNYLYAVSGGVDETCKPYSPVCSADMLGYMYHDNKIEGDTAMFVRLNEWVDGMNGTNLHKYARWARPGLAEINGDLPVLLISDFSSADVESTEDFRSLATYDKGEVLQYGGTVRDGNDKHLSTMLERDEYVFVYGDVVGRDDSGFDGDEDLATVNVNADKVSIYEHASIQYPGNLSNLGETYVGITFDNSFGHATSTPGVNFGLLGIGGYLLPRDWHMFSSPLDNAPLGFDYQGDNEDTYTGGDYSAEGHYHSPWISDGNEFSWVANPGSEECASGVGNRYWMKDFVASDQRTDGYFPTRRGDLFDGHVNDLFIVGSDECPSPNGNRYPYGMDFYTWNEPEYHWINFKRNGPNHWHSDEPHAHLDYVPVQGATANQNEDKLIVGRGYMASITTGTFLQSHGVLNKGIKSIPLTNTSSSKLKGWNLVGNPYHGYLDFDLVAKGNNLDVLSDQNYFSGNADEGAFYVVYNADKYQNQDASTAFRYYPVHGSSGGDYAERYLHPHQGFYVKAKAEGNLSFNEGMLVSRSDIDGESTFRDDRPAYPLVNLYLSSDQGCADVTVIEFERPEWGGATKLKELRVGDGLFYAQHDNTHYAALFAQQGIDRVPVWFEAKEDDIFTMKWNTANGDFHTMYLIDHITGIEYDMLRNDTYTFEGHKGDYPSRFLIVFSLTDVEEQNEIQTFVFFDGSQWIVTGDGQLDFVDPLGQVLMTKQVHGGQSRVGVPDVAPGVYLFRLTNSEGTRIQKVVVKR